MHAHRRVLGETLSDRGNPHVDLVVRRGQAEGDQPGVAGDAPLRRRVLPREDVPGKRAPGRDGHARASADTGSTCRRSRIPGTSTQTYVIHATANVPSTKASMPIVHEPRQRSWNSRASRLFQTYAP